MATDAAKLAVRNYGFIKGRLAEGIIERLFISLDIDVYPVGIEVKNPHIAKLKSNKKIKTQPIEKFEYGPDFLLCQKDTNDDLYSIYEVEVKFRKTSSISVSELKKYKDPRIIFIFLDRKKFYCIENSEFKKIIQKSPKFKNLKFKDCRLLENHPIFKFSSDQKNIIYAFSYLIESSLNMFTDDKILSKTIKKKCNDFYSNNLRNKFNKTKDC